MRLKRNTTLTIEHTTYIVDEDGNATAVTPDSIIVSCVDALGVALAVAVPTAGDPSTLAIGTSDITATTVGPLTFTWEWTYSGDTTVDVDVIELESASPTAHYDTWGELLTRIRRELEEPTAAVWSDESLRVWAFEAASNVCFQMHLPEPYEFTQTADAVQVPRHALRAVVSYALARAFAQVSDGNKSGQHEQEYAMYLHDAYLRYARGSVRSPVEVW